MQACMRSTGRRPGVSRRQLRAALSLAQSSGRVFDHEFGLFQPTFSGEDCGHHGGYEVVDLVDGEVIEPL